MNNFEKKISSFIEEQCLFNDCKKVLVAVSGGVDSVALLTALCNIKKAKVAAAHINHNLRGKHSDADEAFVKELANKLGIDFFTESVNVNEYATQNALSIETAARDLRMNALHKFVTNNSFDAVITGHHKDDNAETMIHRLMRGTGFKGLAGINPKRKLNGITFISPMLSVTRNEIVEYANTNNLQWQEDHTNAKHEYTRNRIRHLLIPELEKNHTADLTNNLAKLSSSCRQLNSKIAKQIQTLDALKTTPTGTSIDIEKLCSQSKPVQIEIIRQSLNLANCGLRHITTEHYQNIIHLCQKESGKKIELPGGFIAAKNFDNIFISKSADQNPKQTPSSKLLAVNGEAKFGNFLIKAEVLDADICNIAEFVRSKNQFIEWFDLDKINGDMIVRQRQEGDKFRPIGLGGIKKVGKFITTSKIDYSTRDEVIIVADEEKIVWLCPLRACQVTKVTTKTRKILQLCVSQRGD